MSHFAVCVVTPTKPEEDELETILQPWHEYECTGVDDEYVVDVETAEGEVVHTNPNAKWDWWQVGGRWTGHLDDGYDPETDPRNIEVCRLCAGTGKREDMEVANGCNGCGGKGKAVKWPTNWVEGPGNQAKVGDLDLSTVKATFAVVMAGQWIEKGEMGWFGCVIGEKDQGIWEEEFRKLLGSLPEDSWLTIVDCHI